MSSVNETTEMWREVHQDQQKARAARKVRNLTILAESTIKMDFRNYGEVVLIRDARYPGIDFYPSTNKWNVGGRMMLGDATALLAFLERRRKA